MKTSELLTTFKLADRQKDANDTAVILVADDAEALALLTAWQFVPVTPRPEQECSKVRQQDRWTWLWLQYDFNPEVWLAIAALPNKRSTQRKIEKLKFAKLIYPDGTYPPKVFNFLRQVATEAMPGQIRKLLDQLRKKAAAEAASSKGKGADADKADAGKAE